MAFFTGMRKFRIDQDFLIEHWHMIYVMAVVFAEIYVWMKLKFNFRYKISINWPISIAILLFKPLISDLKIVFLHFGVNRHIFLIENGWLFSSLFL